MLIREFEFQKQLNKRDPDFTEVTAANTDISSAHASQNVDEIVTQSEAPIQLRIKEP